MNYEKEVERLIKKHTNNIPEETDLEDKDLEQIIDECVTVDESWPIYRIDSAEFNSSSRKPNNVKVEFDIEACFEILAQSGYLTGDPAGIFAAISSFCALVSRKTKIDLEPETGFVYWVAYNNQTQPWEIPKQKLVELASQKSDVMDVHFDLSENEIENRIQRLCKIKSFSREHRQGEEVLILRERCSSDWSS